MKNVALELPPGLFTDQQTQILNDRLREIQQNLGIAEQLRDDLDAAGKRIKNLGDSRDGGDAINQRTGDERYPRGGSSTGPGGPNVTTVVAGSGDATLFLAVSGALSVQADAAPIAILPTARGVREIVALLKIAPADGPVIFDILVGGTKYVSVTIPQGGTLAKINGAGLRPIAANQPIRLDIIQVGKYPFTPGDGLTVQIRFV